MSVEEVEQRVDLMWVQVRNRLAFDLILIYRSLENLSLWFPCRSDLATRVVIFRMGDVRTGNENYYRALDIQLCTCAVKDWNIYCLTGDY